MKRILRSLSIAPKIAILLMAPFTLASAQVVFQADFNGTNTGTGGPTNIATFGGTATLVNGTNLTTSIATSPTLLPGALGFLHLNDTGSGSGVQGVGITPSSAAHSFDSWYSAGSSFVSVNGAIDFFFRDSNDSSTWTTGSDFRPLDVNGGSGGLRLIINSYSTSRLQAEFVAYLPGASSIDIRACPSTMFPLIHGTLYHIAVVVSTNPSSGIVTLKIFQVPGNTTINTASSAYLLASVPTSSPIPSTGSTAITHAFNTASGFTFGQNSNSADTKTLDFGSLRIYNAIPVAFNSVTYLPPMAVTTPSGNPTLPTSYDLFNPPFSGTAAATNTPVMAEWTRTANPGDGLVLSGNNFSTSATNSVSYGKDSSFAVYGQASTNVITPAAAAGIRRLSNNSINSAAIEFPTNLPSSSMYVVWPQNANGAGAPIMVNQAEPWWIGPNIHAAANASLAAGQFASVYGRNLALGTTLTPEVWIQQSGASSGVQANVSAYNPYKIDFTIPGTLSNGTTYQVWVHNGHGGAYGWGLCGQPLVLATPISWSQNVPVAAPSNNAATDTANVLTAINTASNEATLSNGATVSFQSGTYLIDSSLSLPANVKLSGTTSTELQMTGTNISHLINITGTNASIANMVLDEGALSTNTNPDLWLLHGALRNGPGQGSYFTNVTLTGTNNLSQQLIYIGPCQNTFFENCTFIGGGVDPSSGTQLFFDGCTFKTMYDSLTINLGGGLNGFSITNCAVGNNGTWAPEVTCSNAALTSTTSNMVTLTSTNGVAVGDTVRSASGNIWYDTISNVDGTVITLKNPITGTNEYPSKPDAPGGLISIFNGTNVGQGIFVKGLNNTAARTNLYYGNNTTTDFADPCSIDNWGENISFEGNCGQFYGTPTSVSGNTMTFTTQATSSGTNSITTPNQRLLAIITAGSGMGQTRLVDSYSLSGSNTLTATIDSPWNLPPDSTSTVAIGEYGNDVVIYKNTFGGESYFAKHDSNGHGAVLSAGTTQMIIDSNTMTSLDSGMDADGQGQRDEVTGNNPPYLQPANHMQPEYFDLVTNNTINSCFIGIDFGGGGEAGNATFPAVPAVYNFGQIYRQNTISNPILAGVFDFSSNDPSGFIPSNEMLLMDDNTGTNCPSGIFFSQINGYTTSSQQGDTIFTGNAFSFGGTDPGIVNGAYGDPFGYGIDWTSSISLAVALNDNTYTGFTKGNYSSSGLGAVLEQPMRSFTENASLTLTSSVTDSIVLWNDGVSALNWTVTATCDTGAGWLSVSPASGSAPTENSTSLVNFTCNGSALATGTYTGHITATATGAGGTLTRTTQVTFNVGP